MGVKIKKQLISSTPAMSGRGNGRKYITIHETANTAKGAGAQSHANLQSGGNSRAAAWHWQVDDKLAIQSFTHDFQLWHAGDGGGNGNMNSIGVEICVNSDANQTKAYENAAALVKKIMKDEGISQSNVVQHGHWSGKDCPHFLRDGSKGVNWADFNKMIKGEKVKPSKPSKTGGGSSSGKSIGKMADEVIAGKHGSGNGTRRKSLGISKAEYEKVRAEVNKRLGGGSSKPSSSGKSITTMAKEVIAGKHGSGHANRRKSLGISKAQYDKVRAKVNELAGGGGGSSKSNGKSIAQMAKEVAAGKHGNGHETRRKSLGVSKAIYEKVRAKVNGGSVSSSGGGSGKSISKMADEVIKGLHGNGHAARRKSLGVSKATYNKVKKEVNKRL